MNSLATDVETDRSALECSTGRIESRTEARLQHDIPPAAAMTERLELELKATSTSRDNASCSEDAFAMFLVESGQVSAGDVSRAIRLRNGSSQDLNLRMLSYGLLTMSDVSRLTFEGALSNEPLAARAIRDGFLSIEDLAWVCHLQCGLRPSLRDALVHQGSVTAEKIDGLLDAFQNGIAGAQTVDQTLALTDCQLAPAT